MSLRSMTGHGSGIARGGGLSVRVELSSINRRQLEIQINLPRNLAALEARVQEEIHGAISRGRVTGAVALAWTAGRAPDLFRLDEALAAEYLRALRRTARRLDLRDDFTGSMLLTLPNVFQSPEETVDLEKTVWPLLRRAVQQALRGLLQMKTREGGALGKDLAARFRTVGGRVREIKRQAPRVAARYRDALLQRIREAGVGINGQDERLIKEIVFFADRSDITEEVTRMESHLEQGRRLLRGSATTGKTLDFLAQEMFREINTIGSKAGDAAVLEQVVTCKAEVERIREQVQNLE